MKRGQGTFSGGSVYLMTLAFAGLLVLAPACGDSSNTLPRPGPGVIFSYPFNGQMDVPLGARVVVTFTDAIDSGRIPAHQ